MKRLGLRIGLMGLMAFAGLNTIACAPVREAYAGGEVSRASAEAGGRPGDSCLAPTSEERRQLCAEWERQALTSTVRLEVRVFSLGEDGYPVAQVDGSSGHAAVKDGRYLVTHNHYSISLTAEAPGTISRLTLLKADGEVILSNAPLSVFQIAFEDSETQVLDFGEPGLFAARGLSSATFGWWQDFSSLPGMEVAQIDWDGQTSHVEWVRVTAAHTDVETPYLELDNYVERGASGGGVFFNGVHIANNWSHSTDRAVDTGEVMRQYSVAALNTPNGLAIAND